MESASRAKTEHLHFAELLQIVRLRKGLVYVLTGLAIAGAVARQVLYVPVYTGEASLNVQRSENNPLQAALANIGGGYSDASPEKLQRYLTYLSSYEYFLAVAQAVKFQEGYNRLNLGHPAELSVTGRKFWKQLLSTRLGGKPTAPPKPVFDEPELIPVESLASFIMSVSTAVITGNETIKLRVTTLAPFTSMVIANAAAEVFVRKTTERDYNEVGEVKRFIQQQLDGTTERLKRSELALVEFKRRHNIISIDAEHSAFSGKLGHLEGDIEANKIKLEENRKLIEFYERAIRSNDQQILSQGSAGIKSTAAETTSRLRQQMESLRYKKVLMQAQGYSEESWQMAELNKEIDAAAAQLKDTLARGDAGSEEIPVSPEVARRKLSELKGEIKGIESKVAALEKSRGDLLKSLGTLPQDEQILLTLKRDVDLQFELYSMLKKKLQEVEIQQVALQSRVSVGQRSELPPPAPRTGFLVKILFALLVGVFLGATISFFLEAVDPTVKHRSDLDSLELTTLGSIPHVEGSPLRKKIDGQSYRPDLLVCREMPESPESMAFKHLRAQLSSIRGHDGKHSKIITVASPERGEGKSFISSNLAIAFSQLEKRTVLIDCDLRSPSLPWLFGYKGDEGLSSLLNLKASLDEVLIKNWMPNLDILPAGWCPPNPTELLSHDKFRILIDHLRSMYDYIVIDSAPVITVVDASVLASMSDVTILIASFRKTRKETMVTALHKMFQITHKQMYAVLNNVQERPEHRSLLPMTHGIQGDDYGDTEVQWELRKFEQALGKKRVG